MKRRMFLKMAATLAGAFGVSGLPLPVQAALKRLDPSRIPQLIYLQGLSCTGCSISLLQSTSPSPLEMITDYSQLVFHTDLSATSGKQAMALIDDYIQGRAGDYFLALEGSIPAGMPEACVIGHRPIADIIAQAAQTMSGAVAVGTCACDGGIPAAEGNPTGAVGLAEFLSSKQVDKPLIQIPGCSVHPDWLWQTIVHLVRVGMPELKDGAPKLFFQRTVHEQCPRYHDFQQEIYAEKLGDKGCLFKLGCLGPVARGDCPTRWWNGGQTWCIDCNAPCIGCTSPSFARKKSQPFYRLSEINRQEVSR
ncbi:MAG: hydrogenase [Desulfobulbaceae bacterium]|nr:MAG: hydrogenase [Desulfobulbaceae bacterium]